MERTALSFSAVNIITVNLMVLLMVVLFAMLSRVLRGRANA
jgi:hypothetical protein